MDLINRSHIKGDVFRATLYMYFVAEIAWVIFWSVATLWLVSVMTPSQWIGTRFATDYKDLIMHVSAYTLFIYATARAHHSPEFLVLIGLFIIVVYNVVVLIEVLRFVPNLPPSGARSLQYAMAVFQVINSGWAFLWYLFYSIATYRPAATKKGYVPMK